MHGGVARACFTASFATNYSLTYNLCNTPIYIKIHLEYPAYVTTEPVPLRCYDYWGPFFIPPQLTTVSSNSKKKIEYAKSLRVAAQIEKS